MTTTQQEDTAAVEEEVRPGVGSDPNLDAEVAEAEIEQTFLRTIDEGRRRMSRRLMPLLGTGAVGGIDVGTGVLGLLLVEHLTGDVLLAGLAFSIGFISLTLARSELFTEDFLVPVSTVIARQARFRMLLRLWAGTLVANLVAGWVFTWLIMQGYPDLADTAVKAGSYYVDLGIGLRSFALALVGGTVITLMTWMQHSTESTGVKVIPSVGAAFLLAGGQLNHAIVNSLLMFAALHTGQAPFGYAEWAATASWAALGNLVGGVGLVTLLRLTQVAHKVGEERSRPAPGVPVGDHRRAHDKGQTEEG
ncbi:MAG: formate/nitrite transporter family protein [Actinomycetota bacterium]|nr:formate/nitrite transporter family protein [Actinomycetota bacterium]